MWIFILEAAVTLSLLLLIVWATWPRRRPPTAQREGYLTEERAFQVAQEFIKNTGYKEPRFNTPWFESHNNSHSTGPVNYWVVPFVHQGLVQEEGDFVYIEESTGKVMYVLTAQGRRFVENEQEPALSKDDEV